MREGHVAATAARQELADRVPVQAAQNALGAIDAKHAVAAFHHLVEVHDALLELEADLHARRQERDHRPSPPHPESRRSRAGSGRARPPDPGLVVPSSDPPARLDNMAADLVRVATRARGDVADEPPDLAYGALLSLLAGSRRVTLGVLWWADAGRTRAEPGSRRGDVPTVGLPSLAEAIRRLSDLDVLRLRTDVAWQLHHPAPESQEWLTGCLRALDEEIARRNESIARRWQVRSGRKLHLVVITAGEPDPSSRWWVWCETCARAKGPYADHGAARDYLALHFAEPLRHPVREPPTLQERARGGDRDRRPGPWLL
jgi:hypothetical protein